jgi:hypothetical protein
VGIALRVQSSVEQVAGVLVDLQRMLDAPRRAGRRGNSIHGNKLG